MENFELAITGNAFMYLIQKINMIKQANPDKPKLAVNCSENKILQKVLKKAKVFARMTSDEKSFLVKKLKSKDTVVGMWGDGANDCKALKTADIGLSLSEAEASIAAPFTSTTTNISSIVTLLREGKTSLCTTFQLFKMIFLSSIIQSSGVFTMYYLINDYNDVQFLYIDLFILFPIIFFMAATKPSKRLTHHIPVGSLISAPILFSIVGQAVIHITAMFLALFLVKSQDWYFPIITDFKEKLNVSYENTTLFLFSNIQYISTLFAYNIAKPYMKPMYTNVVLSVWITITVIVSYYIIIEPSDFVIDILTLAYLPKEYRYELAFATFVNLAFSYLFEKVPVRFFTEYWNNRKEHSRGYI
jgi:cation-transporting ATPase 13A2